MSKIIIEIVDSNVVLNIESSNLLILEYQLKRYRLRYIYK